MEWLDARVVLEDEPELQSAEDSQRATHEWWRFTTTSVLQLWLTAQEREGWLTLFALSGFANTSGKRPAEGRAARDDEGLRTHEHTTGEPTAEGRTARHDDSSVDGNEALRNADLLPTRLRATRPGREREPRATNSERAASRLNPRAKFVLRGSNVRHERRAKGREAAFGTSAR